MATLFLFLVLTGPAFAEARQKSAVLAVYINNSGTTYNDVLDKIVETELQKRLEGLYIELDGNLYKPQFAKIDVEAASVKQIIDVVHDSGADYLVYIELYPFNKAENYNLIYHRKSMTSNVFLWLIDIKNRQTLYKDHFSLKSKDETDAWLIGNKSVAKKALTATMFKVGEIISAKLPI